MHEACRKDADKEGKHACFDGGEKCDIDDLHAECQLENERYVGEELRGEVVSISNRRKESLTAQHCYA